MMHTITTWLAQLDIPTALGLDLDLSDRLFTLACVLFLAVQAVKRVARWWFASQRGQRLLGTLPLVAGALCGPVMFGAVVAGVHIPGVPDPLLKVILAAALGLASGAVAILAWETHRLTTRAAGRKLVAVLGPVFCRSLVGRVVLGLLGVGVVEGDSGDERQEAPPAAPPAAPAVQPRTAPPVMPPPPHYGDAEHLELEEAQAAGRAGKPRKAYP